ncbi:MAG: ribonuclease H family protein [Lachnospiraceae bacterium]|nr:ribonuclease H family protein [Lachnospiraceae bacterium]
MANKYYAVKVGKTPGIYNSWDECKANVDGYSGALYKSFKTLQEAKEYMGVVEKLSIDNEASATNLVSEKPYAFVDGSFNPATNVYGYGGFLIADGKKYILTGSGDDPEMSSMRNVAGEVLGSQAAMEKAMELGLKEITIYYDYAGIEMWALGNWKRNKKGTIAYYDFVNSIRHKLALYFVKVKGHSGVEGNEEADILAKKAVGIE